VARGRPAFILVAGEAGIGKSRLADELANIAVRTGGFLLAARCYDTERSLFLQPVVEAVAVAARTLSPSAFRDLAGDNAVALADLVPDAAAVLGPVPTRRRGGVEMERRRAFDAVTGFIVALAARTPVLLALDDLQNAGRSTVEFLHYLRRRLVRDRLLIVASVRAEEGADVLDSLGAVADRIDLGPLPAAAVAELAGDAGQGTHAGDILRRTGGHALYVMETLRALTSGTAGLPPSLEAAVSARVRRAGRPVEDLLRAGAVLGSTFDPGELAALTGSPVHVVAGLCADAMQARLLAVAGRDYEFAHDLVREVLYATTPAPTRNAYHLRAADLLTNRPEALAAHAAAAEDWPRAARGWLLAGEQALGRAAAGDAVELLGRCVAAVEHAAASAELGDVRARALLTRGRAQAAQAVYAGALTDIEQAVEIARSIGDRRLEMLALRELGGEIPTALGRSVADCIGHLERGLVLATSLSDRTMQADTQAWLAILAANGLRFSESVRYGESAVRAARASGDIESLAAALDGRKTSLAYIGEVGELQKLIDELDPLLRRLGDLFRLHWAVFESSFGAIARGDWTAAADRIKAALEVQRQSGYTAYAGWHVAHLGWLARLQGNVDGALEFGRRALELCGEAPHVWCTATAGALLGTTLLEIGEREAAVRVLESARAAADQEGADAYVLRCAAPLAEATGSLDVLLEADALIAGITAPDESAFLAADWCYLAVARAWLGHGEPERARTVLSPLVVAAQRCGWVAALAGASAIDGHAASLLGLDDVAARQLGRARRLARRHGLPGIERAAAANWRQSSSAILPAARRAPSRSTGR
jgi:tetratricopeptide (TPR) repeat protein